MGWCDPIKTTKQIVMDSMLDIVCQTYLSFTVNCQNRIDTPQVISVSDNKDVHFVGNFMENAGCLACTARIKGDAVNAYNAAVTHYPRTGLGDPVRIADIDREMCALVCQDLYVTDISQDANLTYTSTCQISGTARTNMIQQATQNIMQTLNSNADALAAVANAIGGGQDIDVEQHIHTKLENSLTVSVLAEMQTSMSIYETMEVRRSSSVFSAGINQGVILSSMKQVLVNNGFVASMFSDTDIDSTTDVKNDENTVQAALDAIQKISDALAHAAGSTFSALSILFALLIGFGGLMFFAAIAFQVRTNDIKNELKRLCGVEEIEMTELSVAKKMVQEGKEIYMETKGMPTSSKGQMLASSI